MYYRSPRQDYRRDKPRRNVPVTLIVALYIAAIAGSIVILVR